MKRKESKKEFTADDSTLQSAMYEYKDFFIFKQSGEWCAVDCNDVILKDGQGRKLKRKCDVIPEIEKVLEIRAMSKR